MEKKSEQSEFENTVALNQNHQHQQQQQQQKPFYRTFTCVQTSNRSCTQPHSKSYRRKRRQIEIIINQFINKTVFCFAVAAAAAAAISTNVAANGRGPKERKRAHTHMWFGKFITQIKIYLSIVVNDFGDFVIWPYWIRRYRCACVCLFVFSIPNWNGLRFIWQNDQDYTWNQFISVKTRLECSVQFSDSISLEMEITPHIYLLYGYEWLRMNARLRFKSTLAANGVAKMDLRFFTFLRK